MSEQERKKIAAMSEKEKGVYTRKKREEAEKRLAANPVATALDATACGATTFRIPGKNAELVATRTGLKGPYTDLKIALNSGVTVPKGSVVTEDDGKVIAECKADTCTELRLDITGESLGLGILYVKLDKNKAAHAAEVFPGINRVNEVTCLRGQTPIVVP
jgi:hypothetical protein